MSGNAAVEDVYAAIENCCSLINVPCSRERLTPVLSAFSDGLSDNSVVVMCIADAAHSADVDYNFTLSKEQGEPYHRAVRSGLIPYADHPSSRVLSDVASQCPVTFYGVECGVVNGFKKTYAFFPQDRLGDLSALARIPSMPNALSASSRIFSRYGLDKRVSIIGVDHLRHTVNVYFMASGLDDKVISSLLSDLHIPMPRDAALLSFIQDSFSVYPTFGWHSDMAERICFSSVSPDDTAYPVTTDHGISRFAKNAPYEYPGDRVLVYGPTITRTGVYHKLGVYFRRPESFWHDLPLAARFDQLVALNHRQSRKG